MGNFPDNKSTAAELDSKIEQAAKWLINNPDAKAKDFTDWYSKKFNVDTRWAFEMRKRAFDALGDDKYNTNIEGARRQAVASLLRMFEECEDVKEKLAIRQEISKIQGLYTQKIQMEVKEDADLFIIDPTKIKKNK